jgi:extracellular elastinolytic metalloproteinase
MELSPASPSFLDMRNSILQADTVVNGGQAHKKIWRVFAHRGMGYFAAASDGSDVEPVEDFSTPPPAGTPTGSLTGTVTDRDSGAPVAGTTVAFGGHSSGFAGDYVAVTGADGTYTISGILPGTYPKVTAGGSAGYEPVVRTVSLASRANVLNWTLRRDWAALSAGGEVTAFDGEPWPGCGPEAMLDTRQDTGVSWFAEFDASGTLQPIATVVKLPAAVNIAEIAINPTGTCGDEPSASTGAYKVETSADGTTWTGAAAGAFHIADQDRMNSVPLAPGSTTGVRYVRYTILSTQVADYGRTCPADDLSGCSFVDTVELAVYGTPS